MSKRKIYIVLLLLVTQVKAHAQYQAANWPMQYNDLMLKITPDTFERDSLPYCYYYVFCGGPNGFVANTSLSDKNGNLQLFSWGEDLRNRFGNIVQGGGRLTHNVDYPYDTSTIDGSDPHQQGVILLPYPGDNNRAYLIIKDEDSTLDGQPTRVTATLADISANNDSGKVLRQQVILQNTMLSDARMTACQHANGRDWWLINHQYSSNVIYTHLITPDSIFGPFEQAIGLPGLEPDFVGWSVFSPDGNLFATTTEGMGAIALLDFDRCEGAFSNFRAINTQYDSGYYFNLSFSASGRFLYASNARMVVQYDLRSQDIAASRVQLVHDTAGFPLLGQMVLMPNGKVYQVGWTVTDSMLSVIDSPDIKGFGCGFHLRSLLVPNSIEMTNVPNFPTYNLGPVKGSACDTLSTGISNPSQNNHVLRIMPNPAGDMVTVEFSELAFIGRAMNLVVVNMLGQVVYGLPLNSHMASEKLDLTGFAAGIYTVYLKGDGEVLAVQKLVKAGP